jgi:hypothetical protein
MDASPSDPDESVILTRRERRILTEIEHELRTSDALLDVAVTDGVLPLPPSLIWVGRAALILLPLVLLLPFMWWSGIAALAAAAVVFRLLRNVRSGRGGGLGPPLRRGWSRRHR